MITYILILYLTIINNKDIFPGCLNIILMLFSFVQIDRTAVLQVGLKTGQTGTNFDVIDQSSVPWIQVLRCSIDD